MRGTARGAARMRETKRIKRAVRKMNEEREGLKGSRLRFEGVAAAIGVAGSLAGRSGRGIELEGSSTAGELYLSCDVLRGAIVGAVQGPPESSDARAVRWLGSEPRQWLDGSTAEERKTYRGQPEPHRPYA